MTEAAVGEPSQIMGAVEGYPRDTETTQGRSLRVAHLSPLHGGVANAARQLHAGLLDIGVESRFYASPAPAFDDTQRHIYAWPSTSRVLERADRGSKWLENHTGLTGMLHVSSLFRSFGHFDVIHLHGMDSSWFNLHALPRLARDHALVWTMHDKHLGTGACGYPEFWDACERWKSGCGSCPKVRSQGWWFDGTRFVYRQKKALVRAAHMAVVAPSRWMFDFVSASPITCAQVRRLIPNGVDTETFTPRAPAACRDELRLPSNGKLLMLVASKFDEPRKGLHYCEPLLRRLRQEYPEEVGLVLAGARLTDDVLNRLRTILPVYPMGKVEDPRMLAKAYGACDVTVVTSTIDNFPSVVLESLACGTPVAGFCVGGIPDMVETGRTGILSALGETDDLAVQMSALLKDARALADMRSHCRQTAVQEFGRRVQASRYLNLYSDLCAAKRAGAP